MTSNTEKYKAWAVTCVSRSSVSEEHLTVPSLSLSLFGNKHSPWNEIFSNTLWQHCKPMSVMEHVATMWSKVNVGTRNSVKPCHCWLTLLSQWPYVPFCHWYRYSIYYSLCSPDDVNANDVTWKDFEVLYSREYTFPILLLNNKWLAFTRCLLTVN
jgi:hypothetical protein